MNWKHKPYYLKICNSLKNINSGQQLLLKSFFDKFNFKNNLLLKLGCKIAIFLNLTTLIEKLQKNLWCNFCDFTSISFIVISFHQIPLTRWNAYYWLGTYSWWTVHKLVGTSHAKCGHLKVIYYAIAAIWSFWNDMFRFWNKRKICHSRTQRARNPDP